MKNCFLAASLFLALSAAALSVWAADWPQWRGPEQSGLSRERALVQNWDPDTGENVLWSNDVGGMSSPIVMNAKVYTWTRVGDVPAGSPDQPTALAGPNTREALVCVDAQNGKILWQHLEAVTQTDLPFHRLGWGNVVGDPKAHRIYGFGGQCTLVCLDSDTGKRVWSRQTSEEFGIISTFGGRTPSPALDEDQLLMGGVAFGWGDHAQGQHRLFAFNKYTGELNWSAPTGGRPVDAPYNTPVVAVINGQRLAIFAAGDGGVHAFQVRTGKKIWSWQASKRGLNSSVVVQGSRIYICHSEENFDNAVLGRVSCIDAASGQPKEVWRSDGLEAGFSSPALADGKLYVIDNKGTVFALHLSTGKILWRKNVGTIGKASLVHADGKLFIPEANGRFVILQPRDEKPTVLSNVELTEKLGREYVIFGSVAISDGRIYLQAANKMYCIGDKNAQPVPPDFVPEPVKEEPLPNLKSIEPAWIQVVPADVVLHPGETVTLKAFAFDEKGRALGPVNCNWAATPLTMPPPPGAPPATPPATAGNLAGKITLPEPGPAATSVSFTAEGTTIQGGTVQATNGGITGAARIRVLPALPWSFDFEKAPLDKPPLTWIGAGGKFAVKQVPGEDANKALVKTGEIDLYHSARTYFGDAHMHDYAIAADIKVGEKMLGESRQVPDAGVINTRYVFTLQGNHQRAVIQVWPGAAPTESSPSGALAKSISFKWEPNTWYRMKLQVIQAAGKSLVQAKAWPRSEKEPDAWTLKLEDPSPNTQGSPGLFGESLVTPAKSEIYYDNVLVTPIK